MREGAGLVITNKTKWLLAFLPPGRRMQHRGRGTEGSCKPSGVQMAVLSMFIFFMTQFADANAKHHTLQSIFDACWDSSKIRPWSNQWRVRIDLNYPEPIVLTFQNRSTKNYLEFCVYDSVCEEIVYSGPLLPRSSMGVAACSDKRRRGSILVLDELGRAFRFENLRDRKIKLPIEGRDR